MGDSRLRDYYPILWRKSKPPTISRDTLHNRRVSAIIHVVLRAVIFDCDGVIANTEPLHMAALQRVLAEENIILSKEDYYRDYLAYDDRGAFEKAFRGRAVSPSSDQISHLIERKAAYLEPVIHEALEVYPGVVSLARRAAESRPIAVASGALRREVLLILNRAGIADCFAAVVAAEDVVRGKPNPDAFLEALTRINSGQSALIQPPECLVIEDSILGINAARSAGMCCLAVTNSYPRADLAAADLIVDTLEGLDIDAIEGLVTRR